MPTIDYCLLGFGDNGWPKVRPTAEKVAASLSAKESSSQEEFELSWHQFLREIKAFLNEQPAVQGNARTVAEQARRFEAGVCFSLAEIEGVSPSLKMSDRLFSEVFGGAGKQILNEKEAEVKADVLAYMAETGIEDEREARGHLYRELAAGLSVAIEFLSQAIFICETTGKAHNKK